MGLDIVAAGRRGMLRQEPQVLLEVGPPARVVLYSVAMALEPLAAQVQGGQHLPGTEEHFAVQRDLGDIPRRATAAPLDLLPLLRGALEVSGVLRPSEGPALYPSEALLALGLLQGHKAPF